MPYTKALADYFGKLSFEMLPSDVVKQTKITLLDFMGIAIGSLRSPEAQIVGELVQSWGDREEASVIGLGFKTSCRNAAFCNGILSGLLEFQDGLKFRGIHIAETVPPVVLALGEWKNVKGKDFIASMVTGYEIAARVAEAVFPSHFKNGFMTTGTAGAFGAAAAAAKMLDLGADGILTSLGITTRILPISIEYEDNKVGGFTAKFLHGGQAAKVGLESALMAQAGITSYAEPLAGSDRLKQGFCYMTSDEPKLEKLTEALGELYFIRELYFKPYTACRQTHGAIEATLNMVRTDDISPQDVEAVNIKTHHMAAISTGQNYTNPDSTFVSCQFSIPYVTAVSIFDKAYGLEQLRPERIGDPAVHELAAKVKVVEVPELNENYPDKTPTFVEVVLKDGRVYSSDTDVYKGDPKNPMSEEEFVEKFTTVTRDLITDKYQQEMISKILDLENIDDVSKLMASIY